MGVNGLHYNNHIYIYFGSKHSFLEDRGSRASYMLDERTVYYKRPRDAGRARCKAYIITTNCTVLTEIAEWLGKAYSESPKRRASPQSTPPARRRQDAQKYVSVLLDRHLNLTSAVSLQARKSNRFRAHPWNELTRFRLPSSCRAVRQARRSSSSSSLMKEPRSVPTPTRSLLASSVTHEKSLAAWAPRRCNGEAE